LLGDGESSRLYRKLVVEGLTQDVSVMQSPTQLGSTFIVSATAMEGVSLDRIEKVVLAEIGALASTPPTQTEMDRLKNQLEYGVLSGLQSLLQRATQLNEYDAYTGDPNYLAKDLARYRDATSAGLSQAAATYLKPELAARVVVTPEPEKK
jgi:zinc protease